MENGCLRKIVDGHSCRMLGKQTVATEAIRLAHQQAGRFGRRATYRRLRGKVAWMGDMQKDIEGYIKRCGVCQKNGSRGLKVVPPMLHIGRKFETFNLVAVGVKTLPKTERGNNYMLLVVYYCSKFVAAWPPETERAEAVVSCLSDNVSRVGGVRLPRYQIIAGSFKTH